MNISLKTFVQQINFKRIFQFSFDINKFYANPENLKQKTYYVVCKGRKTGIFHSWNEIKPLIYGYPCAIYKKFTNVSQATDFFLANTNKNIEEKLSKNNEFSHKNISNNLNIIEIYCDGSAIPNGSPDAKAGIGIVFGNKNISEALSLQKDWEKLTNNIAELSALKRVFEIIESENNDENYYKIYSDSNYAINSISVWDRKNNNDPNLKNILLIREICEKYEKFKYKCELIYVKGHDISKGNNLADELAKKACGKF